VAIARDAELVAAGFARPYVARVALAPPPSAADEEDRATRLLVASLSDCLEALDACDPSWRTRRVGLALGTSSGGMRTAERFFARVARGDLVDAPLASRAAYFGPVLDAVAQKGIEASPATLVLCACASSVISIGLAARWLELGECDVALAGGFDAVSPFVASGFEALQATSASVPPRPFRLGRDGMALGEASAVFALVRPDAAKAKVLGYVHGFGASADAVHITAPDRTGAGLARAARAALAEAGEPAIDLLGAHATATPFNDAAEMRGIVSAMGEEAAHRVPVHAFKAQVGHTLGAAGAIESYACLEAMNRGVLPATPGEGAMDPDAPAGILALARLGTPKVALKLASAFGGANAALVLGHEPPPPRPPRAAREAWTTRAVHLTRLPEVSALAASVGVPLEKLGRADAQVLWGVAALEALAKRLGGTSWFDGAGVVVGTAVATLETNARFASRLRDRGPRYVEPRRFPYTSPNAVAGECGVAFGLHGPAFAVGAGLHAGVEALVDGVGLVRSGDADRILVLAVDDVGDVARIWSRALGVGGSGAGDMTPGAVALLLSHERLPVSAARVTTTRTSLGAEPPAKAPQDVRPVGHLALAPLDAEEAPEVVESWSPLLGTWAHARATFTRI
jgi:3-oxoacyl-[acyl-carrier-protein] synthase-1/3-oxoacyl-[acyl-carrier-protein] synthase II